MTLSFTQTIAGKPNYFIEKIWAGLMHHHDDIKLADYETYNFLHKSHFGAEFPDYPGVLINSKDHTIREDPHDRWKPGMDIHFVINNRSPQRFQFAPVVKCKSVQRISIKWFTRESPIDASLGHGYTPQPNLYAQVVIDSVKHLSHREMNQLAINDGFENADRFFDYFNKDFTGKIIHWTYLKY